MKRRISGLPLAASIGLLWMTPLVAQAQNKPDKPSVPVKVQLVFSEYDGEKKIASMPYSFVVITDEKVGGFYSTNLRNGVRIPVQTDAKEEKSTYLDVGANVDCGIKTTDDGHFHLYMIFERSALYPRDGATAEKPEAPRNSGMPPVVRQFKASENMILKDGQTFEAVASTDPLNGHTMRIAVTINVIK